MPDHASLRGQAPPNPTAVIMQACGPKRRPTLFAVIMQVCAGQALPNPIVVIMQVCGPKRRRTPLW
jgi:hypothetical protein